MADETKRNENNDDEIVRVIRSSSSRGSRESIIPPFPTGNTAESGSSGAFLREPSSDSDLSDFFSGETQRPVEPVERHQTPYRTAYGPKSSLYGELEAAQDEGEVVRSGKAPSRERAGKRPRSAAARTPARGKKNPRGKHSTQRRPGDILKPITARDIEEGVTIRSGSAKGKGKKTPGKATRSTASRITKKKKNKESADSKLLSTPKGTVSFDAEKNKEKPRGKKGADESRRQQREREKTERTIRSEEETLKSSPGSRDRRRHIVQETKREHNEKVRRAVIISSTVAGIFTIIIVLALIIGVVRDCTIVNDPKATYPVDTIQLESGIIEDRTRSLILLLKKRHLQTEVTKKLPYVESIDIHFESPYNVTLTVTETSDKFCLVDGNKQIWLDPNGKVLDDRKKSIEGKQTKVTGFDLEDRAYSVGSILSFEKEDSKNAAYFEILQRISNGISKSELNISQIDFKSEKKIVMTMNKVIKIYATGENDFEKKLDGVKKQLNELGEISTDFYFDIRDKEKLIYNYGTLY